MNNTYNNIEEIGIDATKKIITQDFGWIFREKNKRDIGIDAEAETKQEGLLIQIQIKTGMGNFKVLKTQTSGLTYYVDKEHYNYWLNLKAPVLFVAHIPETNATYWQIVVRDNFKKTPKGWKLFIPYANELNLGSKEYILYNCIEPLDPEIYFIPNLKERKVTYSSNVISVDSLGGFNSQRSIEYRQQFARKAGLLQKANHLRKLAYDNPNNYPCRLQLSTVYIDLDDPNNATIELVNLVEALSKPETEDLFVEQLFLIWAKYYLDLITKKKDDYKLRIDDTILILFAKVGGVSKEKAIFFEPISIEICQKGNSFKMVRHLGNCFILSQNEHINTILNNGDFTYQVVFDIITKEGDINSKIENCSCEFELGLMYNNQYLQEYSIPLL